MTKRLLLCSVVLVLSSALALGATEEDISAALSLFPESQDVAVAYSDAGQASLEFAIGILEEALGVDVLFDRASEEAYMALEIDPANKAWANALSQAYYTLGDVFLKDNDAKKLAFVRGQFWGLASLRSSAAFATEEVQHGFIEAVKQETDVAALFWTYGNWTRKDEFDLLGAVFRNDPPKLLALIERCLELDESFMDYAAYRALAAFWGGLPPLPLMQFGQNLPRALSYICPVLNEPSTCNVCADCPVSDDVDDYFENRLIFAEYYLMEMELWDEAARVLQSILDDSIGERYALYNNHCVSLAAELLQTVTEHL
ncbi:TRAP transporter TatT component family protein [Candidatus Bipolaricaulota bacterium]|nr:TRAP transporter TatT component family protein [Candidatus Bipolaricaulota bacterium]